MITLRISFDAYNAALGALTQLGEQRSDPRAFHAAEELRRAALSDVEREIEYANPPPPLPAFIRKQAD